MRSGDLPTPDGSPPTDPPSDTPPSVVVPPATDPTTTVPPPDTPNTPNISNTPAITITVPEVQQPSQAQPTSFFSGLFRKATATLESTIEQVSQNETFERATETLVGLGNSLTSPNPLPNFEMSRATSNTSNGTADVSGATSQFAQRSTVAMRALRVNSSMGAAPLNMFVNEDSRDIFCVTEHAIEAFAMDGSKLLQANLAEQLQQYQAQLQQQQSEREDANGNGNGNNDTAINVGSPHLNSRRNRIYSRPAEGAIGAICSAHIPESEEVVIAHEDASIHVYSLRSGQMGDRLRGTLPLASQATYLSKTMLQYAPNTVSIPRRLLVGASNGLSSLLKLDELSDIAWLHPPEMCETPLGAGSTSAPVACIEPLELPRMTSSPRANAQPPPSNANASVVVGYADGTIAGCKFEDPAESTPFAAHGGSIGGLVEFGKVPCEKNSAVCTHLYM